jgi:hypothetical protein
MSPTSLVDSTDEFLDEFRLRNRSPEVGHYSTFGVESNSLAEMSHFAEESVAGDACLEMPLALSAICRAKYHGSWSVTPQLSSRLGFVI